MREREKATETKRWAETELSKIEIQKDGHKTKFGFE
jgi:hypothetical protein